MPVKLSMLCRDRNHDGVMATVKKFNSVQDFPHDGVACEETPDGVRLLVNYPSSVFDGSFTQFMALMFGEIPYMRGFGNVLFESVSVEGDSWDMFRGPMFGAGGLAERAGAKKSPLLMAILKPSLDPEATLESLERKISATLSSGFHCVKDDEMQGDFPNLPLSGRLKIASENHGYVPAVNMDDHSLAADLICRANPVAAIVNASVCGLPSISAIARKSGVPIVSHLSLQGSFSSSMTPWLYAFIHRLAGCDAFISAIGDRGYYAASSADEAAVAHALTHPLPIPPTMPLLTGGARPENAVDICRPYAASGVPFGLVFGSHIHSPGSDIPARCADVTEALRSF